MNDRSTTFSWTHFDTISYRWSIDIVKNDWSSSFFHVKWNFKKKSFSWICNVTWSKSVLELHHFLSISGRDVIGYFYIGSLRYVYTVFNSSSVIVWELILVIRVIITSSIKIRWLSVFESILKRSPIIKFLNGFSEHHSWKKILMTYILKAFFRSDLFSIWHESVLFFLHPFNNDMHVHQWLYKNSH